MTNLIVCESKTQETKNANEPLSRIRSRNGVVPSDRSENSKEICSAPRLFQLQRRIVHVMDRYIVAMDASKRFLFKTNQCSSCLRKLGFNKFSFKQNSVRRAAILLISTSIISGPRYLKWDHRLLNQHDMSIPFTFDCWICSHPLSLITEHVHNARGGNVFNSVCDSLRRMGRYPKQGPPPPPHPPGRSGVAWYGRGPWSILHRNVNVKLSCF